MPKQPQPQPAETMTPAPAKVPFIEPKLRFIEPKLVKHGDVTKVTHGFLGSFHP